MLIRLISEPTNCVAIEKTSNRERKREARTRRGRGSTVKLLRRGSPRPLESVSDSSLSSRPSSQPPRSRRKRIRSPRLEEKKDEPRDEYEWCELHNGYTSTRGQTGNMKGGRGKKQATHRRSPPRRPPSRPPSTTPRTAQRPCAPSSRRPWGRTAGQIQLLISLVSPTSRGRKEVKGMR